MGLQRPIVGPNGSLEHHSRNHADGLSCHLAGSRFGAAVARKFAISLAIIVGVPPLSRHARLPAVVGLLLAGAILGPHGLDMIGQNRAIADFLAEIGKLLLMFFAGLEIDLAQFRRAGRKTTIFGLLTTLLPQIMGTGVGLLLGYGPLAAIVLGSLLASHTLLGSSIVARLGASRLEPIT